MLTRRAATVVAVLATVGLLVSVAAAWSRLDADDPGVGPGRSVAPATSADRDRTGLPDGPRRDSPSARRSCRLDAGPRGGCADSGPVGAADVPTRPSPGPPVRLTMAGVGLSLPVRPVGVAPDGQMRLPANPRVLGWYRFGAAPGAPGSTVLAGHLDSLRYGLGPLVRLRESEVGDRVRVATSGGRVATYEVVGVQRFDRQSLPAVVFSRSGPQRLRIITCGGEYDAERGGYQQNLVVTAAPT